MYALDLGDTNAKITHTNVEARARKPIHTYANERTRVTMMLMMMDDDDDDWQTDGRWGDCRFGIRCGGGAVKVVTSGRETNACDVPVEPFRAARGVVGRFFVCWIFGTYTCERVCVFRV